MRFVHGHDQSPTGVWNKVGIDYNLGVQYWLTEAIQDRMAKEIGLSSLTKINQALMYGDDKEIAPKKVRFNDAITVVSD